jgi:hypothetical protein
MLGAQKTIFFDGLLSLVWQIKSNVSAFLINKSKSEKRLANQENLNSSLNLTLKQHNFAENRDLRWVKAVVSIFVLVYYQ